jgi:glycylpeptide N-tetradecanoyltransferase
MRRSITYSGILRSHPPKTHCAHLPPHPQPVPKLSEKFQEEENCPIDAEKTVAEVKQVCFTLTLPVSVSQPLAAGQDPYAMPKGFDWVSMDVNDPIQLQEIYTLLTENYVEDDDNMFR